MRVKFLKHDNKRYAQYEVIMPEDREIEDLPTSIQNSIRILGPLEKYQTKDLSNENDDWSLTIKRQIKVAGASLRKTDISHSTGISDTFPPFSVLDEVQHNLR